MEMSSVTQEMQTGVESIPLSLSAGNVSGKRDKQSATTLVAPEMCWKA